jgi:hypothetical protein
MSFYGPPHPHIRYNLCKCTGSYDNLSWEREKQELLKAINNRVKVQNGTTRLVIVTNHSATRINFNNITTLIERGLTFLCLCNLRRQPYTPDITLTADIYSLLKPLPCNLQSTEAYQLIPNGHFIGCNHQKVPSLKSLCYYSLFCNGMTIPSFEKLADENKIPKKFVTEAPIMHVKVINCYIENLVHIYRPLNVYSVSTCNEPESHLHPIKDKILH